jgi:23S rRNA (guanosine2251-2'-O)-methyltransferase
MARASPGSTSPATARRRSIASVAPQKDIAKTALGAERALPWERAASPEAFITRLREKGWHIVGIEQDPRAIDYRAFRPTGPTLFILGNEVRGISPALRHKCDTLVEIPMRGTKESLNVSVAAGVVLFSALAQ